MYGSGIHTASLHGEPISPRRGHQHARVALQVLVHSAAGGVGLAAVDIAQALYSVSSYALSLSLKISLFLLPSSPVHILRPPFPYPALPAFLLTRISFDPYIPHARMPAPYPHRARVVGARRRRSERGLMAHLPPLLMRHRDCPPPFDTPNLHLSLRLAVSGARGARGRHG